ncbi:MAG: acyltransferase [Lachnospiraceae bacterium]|nr:acyltransferase [Lachnospiraceae bacterium]
MDFSNFIGHLKTNLYYRFMMGSIELDALIIKPLKIDNPKSISIGKSSYVGYYGWLMGGKEKGVISLEIGNNVQIGHFSHIVAMKNVIIEDEVLVADKVFISDCMHEYKNINLPAKNQGIRIVKKVIIGEGSWLGENVCVCGASIGKHCVIGANSVVTTDIPDYSVAVGSPAKVVKQFDFGEGIWK